MDQTNTSAGTAHTPRFEQIDTRGVSLSAATMQTSDGDTIRIDRHTSTSFCLHVSGEGFEFGAWLTRPEAIATGSELLKAAGAPDEAQQLREQRSSLLAALRRLMEDPSVIDAAEAGAVGQAIVAIADADHAIATETTGEAA